LTGGAIVNVLRYCALQAVSEDTVVVSQPMLLAGIRREFKKENKTIAK